MSKVKVLEKFKPLYTFDGRYIIITGGRGSAKSFSVSVFILILIFKQYNEVVMFTRKTMTSAHKSIIPEFIEKIELLGLEEYFLVTKTEIKCLVTGSSIIFAGLQSSSGDNTANLKSLAGVTTWILEEGEELTDEDTFDRIDLSIRKMGVQNRVILIMNPATKEHFVYKRYFESAGIEAGSNTSTESTLYIHTTYLDNIKNLSQSFIDRANHMKETNPEKYNHIMLGGWLNRAEGVIFDNYSIGEIKRTGSVIFAQDFGFSIDPTTLIEVYINKDKKEIYAKEHLYKTNLTTSEIFQYNSSIAGNNLIVADSAEPRLIQELKDLGNNIEGADKIAINDGIALIRDFKIIVDPESINLIKELNNYSWSDKGKLRPVDKFNHLLDALRYAVVKSLEPKQELFFF